MLTENGSSAGSSAEEYATAGSPQRVKRRTLTRDGRGVIYDGRRWRIRVKVGHYRFGINLRANPSWGPRWEVGSFGAGLATGNWVRRSR